MKATRSIMCLYVIVLFQCVSTLYVFPYDISVSNLSGNCYILMKNISYLLASIQVPDIGPKDNILQNRCKRGDADASADKDRYFELIPILMSFTKWTIYMDLKSERSVG